MIEIFKALSDESRLRILSLLIQGEMCVCELENCLKLKQPNISRHLLTLKSSGIVVSYKQGQWAYYKISDAFVFEHRNLLGYLQEKLLGLSSYDEDSSRIEMCKRENLCQAIKP